MSTEVKDYQASIINGIIEDVMGFCGRPLSAECASEVIDSLKALRVFGQDVRVTIARIETIKREDAE